MTLARLALAWAAVAALFAGFGWLAGARRRGSAAVLAAESLFLTLLASLWFASLGSGGWLLVFLLVGILASGTWRWLEAAERLLPLLPLLRPTLVTTARYILAGGLLALLLG